MLALIPLFGVAVTVTGTDDCPARPTVEAALAALEQPGTQGTGSVAVEINGTRMTVTVRGEDGSLLSSKTFVEPYSCGERAQVAAVYATTWDVASTLTSPLADVQAPVRAAAPPPAAPTPPAAPVVARAAVRAPPAPSSVLRLAGGVTGVSGAALQENSVGYGLALEGTWRPRPAWGVKLELLGLPERTFAVDVGRAALSRWGGGVAYVRRWPARWGAVAADAGALLVSTRVRGEGFPAAAQSSAWVPGGRVGVGADAPLGFAALRVGFDVSLIVWARSERVAVQSPMVASTSLPQADLLLRLCVAWESGT